MREDELVAGRRPKTVTARVLHGWSLQKRMLRWLTTPESDCPSAPRDRHGAVCELWECRGLNPNPVARIVGVRSAAKAGSKGAPTSTRRARREDLVRASTGLIKASSGALLGDT